MDIFTSNAALTLVANSTLAVKIVLILLVLMSIFSWSIIFNKLYIFFITKRDNKNFARYFEDEIVGLKGLEVKLDAYRKKACARVIYVAFKELKRIEQTSLPLNLKLKILEENLKRALINGRQIELSNLKKTIPFLATCSNAAPFIGLFGTVWGIMHSFHSIGLQKSASLATVAPGISEALIATAIGLAVAIPATMAYNYFLTKLQDVDKDFDILGNMFLNLVQRNLIFFKEKEGE